MSDRPLPSDWEGFKRESPSEALALEARDPELVSLLAGTCSATLKADALGGKFSPIAPDPQVIAEQRRQAQVAELMAQNPWGKQGTYVDGAYQDAAPENLTAKLLLAQADQRQFERMQAANPGPTEEQLRMMREEQAARDAQARTQSMQASYAGGYF